MEGGIRQCCVGVTRLLEPPAARGERTIGVVHDPHPDSEGFVEGAPLAWAGLLVALEPASVAFAAKSTASGGGGGGSSSKL